jgi:O-antigen/teichoic acid export membrane protein
MVSFAMRGFAGNLATFSTISIDQAIIGPVLGIQQLGFYAVAVTVARLPYMVGVSIGFRAFAEVAAAKGDDRGSTSWRFIRLTLLVTVLVAVAVGTLSPVLLPVLYGRAFVPSVIPLLLLLPGTVALSLSATASSCLNALGLPGRSTAAEVLGFVVTVGGLVLVVPRYGINGAAVLSTAAYLVTTVAYLSFLRVLGPVALRPRSGDVSFLLRTARNGVERLGHKRAGRF